MVMVLIHLIHLNGGGFDIFLIILTIEGTGYILSTESTDCILSLVAPLDQERLILKFSPCLNP